MIWYDEIGKLISVWSSTPLIDLSSEMRISEEIFKKFEFLAKFFVETGPHNTDL